MRQFLYGIGLLVAAAVLVWIDQSPSDVANQASLLILLSAQDYWASPHPTGRGFQRSFSVVRSRPRTRFTSSPVLPCPMRCHQPDGPVQLLC